MQWLIKTSASLDSTVYNPKTFQLIRVQDDEYAKITIVTDKLSMVVDVPNVETVTVDPVDLDDLWQKSGHVGRDKLKSPTFPIIK